MDKFEPVARTIQIISVQRKMPDYPSYCANPIMYSFSELLKMVTWCHMTFGNSGYNHTTKRIVWECHHESDISFWFKEEKHAMLFKLRWA
jgi:hypothetical protein